MTWKRDTRPGNVREVGDFRIFSEVNADRETAHVVQFPDGREFRILPDHRSGLARSKLVRQVVEGAQALSERLESPDALLVVFRGYCDGHSLMWEELNPDLDVTIEEWLTAWLGVGGSAALLLEELDVDGWQITRKASE